MNSFNNLDLSKTYTYADYLLWKFEERVELFKGKIVKMSPAPGRAHQTISFNIAGELYSFLKNKSYRAFTAPFDVRLIKDESSDHKIKTVVQPDICVVCDLNKLTDHKGCKGAPDLVVEILSPGNNQREVNIKYDLYEEFGVKEYWVVYPTEQVITIYRLNAEGKYIAVGRSLTIGDILTTNILPGFELKMDDVFRGL